MKIDLEYYKTNLVPYMEAYEIEYKHFEEGDFGSLTQIEFNNEKQGGNIDFWELGQVGIFLWSYEREEEIFNIFLNPEQEQEKKESLDKLKKLL